MTAAAPLAQWTVCDVCTNLRGCAWCSDELLVMFAANKVDGPCLLDLTLEDLQNDFFINIKSEAEEILARVADLAGWPLPADGGGNAAAANAAAKAAAAAVEEDAQRQQEAETKKQCAGEGSNGSSACAEQETIQALEDNLRSILRRTAGYDDVDCGEGAGADESLLRESLLASPSPQPAAEAAAVGGAAAGASRSSSPAGSNASSTAEEDLSVPPHYHAEDTMPWVTFVDLQLRRAERCSDGDTLRWLGAADGGLLDLSRVRMYDADGCSDDVRRERRRRYKLCAKRAERMRMFGVLDGGAASDATAAAAAAQQQPSTPTRLASTGLLEGFRREALLCELFDSWARARTVDVSGPAEAAVPFGGLMLSLRVFFYWGDAVSDPEDRALQVVVDRRGCVGRAGFVSYVARLTALLPGAEFEQMEAFVRRCVVAPLQAAQRARRRDHILFELYKTCEAAGGVGSRGLRGETLRGVLSGYDELLLDGERALAMDASAAGARFFADEVRGAAFVEGFRRLTDGFADDQLEQVLFKLGRSFEREREREAERVRCRLLQDGDFLRSDAAAAAAASDVVVVGEAEVRAAYLLSTRKTPVVFVGPLADPASALESFAFERHAHLRYCCVQTEAAAEESLGRLRRAVAKGVWFYAAVSAALPSFDGYLREVALLLEGCAEVLVHKRFRMFLHVPDAALPEVLMRRAVSIRADVYDTYNKRYVIRAGVSEGERTWR